MVCCCLGVVLFFVVIAEEKGCFCGREGLKKISEKDNTPKKY